MGSLVHDHLKHKLEEKKSPIIFTLQIEVN
jgi:hypothetical protein